MNVWKNISKLSRSEQEQLQGRKLQKFIRQYVLPFSSHYKKQFEKHNISAHNISSIKDLSQLPFTSKADFILDENGNKSFKNFVLKPTADLLKKHWRADQLLALKWKDLRYGKGSAEDFLAKEFRPVFMTFTTGTTGYPIPFLYSNYDLENLKISGSRMMSLFQNEPDDTSVNMFPYAPHLAFWQVVYGGIASNALVMSSGGGKVMGTDGNITIIKKMRPKVLLGVPSYVYHVLRVAKDRNEDFSFIRKVVVGAARVTEGFKQKVVDLLESMGAENISVFGTYGFTESRSAWAECPTGIHESSGYHLYPDKEIFEVIDPKTGEVKKEGEDGELVYTSLDARGSVVLRYRTGDFVKGGIRYDPCPHCGLNVPRISSDITRLSDIKDLNLSKIKGSLVNLSHFDKIFSELPWIEEWQIELKKKNDDEFEVDEFNVFVTTSEQNLEDLMEKLKTHISTKTEVCPNQVNFIGMKEMVARLELETANKEKRIVDRRPKQ